MEIMLLLIQGMLKLAATLWKHGSVLSTDVTMIGDAPVLDLTYTPEAGKISAGKINTKQDIKVRWR